MKYYNLLTPESETGPFNLIAMKTWEFIYNIKEFYAKGVHINLGIRPFRAS